MKPCGDPGSNGCFEGFCYEFIKVPQGQDWNSAKQQCETQDEDLLSIHSENESQYLTQLLCCMGATLGM